MRVRTAIPASALLLITTLAAACGGSSSNAPDTVPPGGSSSSGAGGSSSGSGSSSSGAGGSSSGSSSGGGTVISQSYNFGTYISLGDSISAGGGVGPFFNDLLFQNDDTTYPTWKGHDLSTKFPGIKAVNAALGGAISGPYNDIYTIGAPQMITEITNLGMMYGGDVLVTITIGGNDLNFHAPDAVNGLDAPDRMKFAANLKADLDALSASGRLGSGKVAILEANVYDPSDGMGNFMSGGGGCPKFNVPGSEDTMVFGAWNDLIATAVADHSMDDALMDLHGLFQSHGFNSMDNWFNTDCLHPNAKGHEQLRRAFWHMITGEQIGE
jgi:lysophospholipase L1-like esterase